MPDNGTEFHLRSHGCDNALQFLLADFLAEVDELVLLVGGDALLPYPLASPR